MTLEKDRRECLWRCDSCGEETSADGVYGADDFRFAWNELTRDGWVAFMKNGEWEHKCPRCARGGPSVHFEKV